MLPGKGTGGADVEEPKSQHGDRFDHDPWAERYDAEVRDETDPIRAGYDAVLEAVAAASALAPPGLRVDLGCGTGNLSLRLPPGPLLGVDRSVRMLDLARAKLSGRADLELVREDLLRFAFQHARPTAAFVSTYALHHLTDPEKQELLARLSGVLVDGGLLAIGDLMFEDAAARAAILEAHPELVADVDDEFFWDLSLAKGWLSQLGFAVSTRRFSLLSWVLVARGAPSPP